MERKGLQTILFNMMHYETSLQEDRVRIQDFINMSLPDKHRITIQKKPYLIESALDLKLRGLKVIKCNSFYEFTFPEEMEEIRAELQMKRNQERALRQTYPEEHYDITRDEISNIIETSTKIITDGRLQRPGDHVQLAIALMIVTGRRCIEVVKEATFGAIPERPYQAMVSGIAKRSKDGKAYSIPLLLPFRDVQNALIRLRAFKNFDGLSSAQVNHKMREVSRNVNKLFGRKLDHTQRRNIYVEVAYENRHVNGFYPSLTKHQWAPLALTHQEKVAMSTTDRYQMMNIIS